MKIKTGAWITYQFDDLDYTQEAWVSFGEYCEETETDSNGIDDNTIFAYTTEEELKDLLKSGEYNDEWKVISIDEYTFKSNE